MMMKMKYQYQTQTNDYEERLLAEARAKGREQGRLEMISELVSDGLISCSEAAKRLSMTEAQLKEVIPWKEN